ncbi:GW domain-containing glycosaminoglycan-binding protein [Listeria innocua]|uniref:GW domain-containing glycosaminoglycan-binding protein n=1 Tax=Listeria innocua TaxID=1642 RepID=UPI0013658CB8|nr:GW domain-containing glycosaminoglycan-binding protein [Listeria innocua]MWW20024.1 GW domain-containing glycosaminoglycan-binding protein [Listeria monocytogenes]EAF5667527.1 GW domain-containing glycosaminoglycan-binding protein [Listeria innocua]EAG9436597.1 GW domain-containing glycosaminoglycan-binding protein [Listeria innocua]EIX3330772.1 GW domain-containing glycosaminoglycan-binding protein [Listeria innocua]EKF1864202.1 GW domain-containing glycosaminoglycan-binding protein [Liste
MKKLVKSAVVIAGLALIGTSATLITEKASASSIETVQKVDDQSIYIPQGIRDGTATEEHDGFEDETNSVLKTTSLLRATTGYPDVNAYIKSNKFSTASIEKQLKSQFPKFNYRNGYGKPEGVVIHETANNSSTIEGEISYMSRNYNNAFVHSFVDKSRIIQIHPTENGVWGAGQYANARFIQVELVRSKTFDEFARSINNYAYYAAYLLDQYKLPVDSAHSDGKGTIWSHDAVTRYLGGTTHTDPVGYFNQWGYNFNSFVTLINEKYKAIQASKVTYDKIEYDKAVTAYARVKTAPGNAVWTKPYKTEGSKLVNQLSVYQGKNMRILREAKTPITTWYQFSIDGKTIGWVDTRALNTFYKQSMEKPANLTRYVAANKTGEAYYKVPVADSAVKWGTLATYKNEKLTVDSQATVEGQLWYRVRTSTTFIGWTKAENLTATSPFDTIEYDKGVTAYARVKTAPGNAVWTKPYKTEGANLVNQLSVYQGKNMRILREAKTPITTWYQFSIDGKTIGWVDTRALDTFYKQSMEQPANLTRYVTANKTGEAYYKVPVADSAVKWGTLATYKNEKLTVDSQATIEGQLWYRVRTSTTFIGWTKAENLTTTSPFDTIEYDKGVTAYARVKTAPGNAVWTKPYRTEGANLVNQLSVYQGKNMRILREAKTPITTWYQFSIDGKTIGWVDTRALDTFYKQSMEQPANLTRYVAANKTGEAYYKVPVADSAVKWGTLATYKNEKLTVDSQATVEGQLWYRVRTSTTFIGWTKASNLSTTK